MISNQERASSGRMGEGFPPSCGAGRSRLEWAVGGEAEIDGSG